MVAEAKDGDEACRKYMMYKPDLVTMDITMHGMNGLDAVKEIVSYDKNARIVMVSAMSQKNMVIRALKNGAKHFIIKPITVEKVIKVVNEVMGIKNDDMLDKEEFQDIKQSIEEMKKALKDFDKEESQMK